MSTDQLEKNVRLKASKGRVWRALTDSTQFGSWFGMRLEGPFITHSKLRGVIVPTEVDPEVAKMQRPHEGKAVELFIEQIEPEKFFSFKWHPFAIDPKIDYSKEAMTLVLFKLEEKNDGVLLTVTESGFDKIPISRRAEALKANEGGWSKQMELIKKYLTIHNMFDNSKAFSSFSTNDLKKAKKFYGNILGLDVAEEGQMGLRINLASSAIVFIYPKENHEPASFTVLNFPVDDIEKTVDELTHKGISLEKYEGFAHDEKGICRNSDPKNGPAAIAWFKDPAGNIISILQENVETV